MQTTKPGQITTVIFEALPTAGPVGFQVLSASTGLVAIARTEVGVVERPPGTQNYAVNFTAPVEGDIYLVVADWNAGVLVPDMSMTKELNVSTVIEPGSTGLGLVADYAKMRLGGSTWKLLSDDPNFGVDNIALAIETVKMRSLATPPATVDEGGLDKHVLDYLGILAALELIPPARDLWGQQAISLTRGDDASETITYANRTTLMNELRDDLMRVLPAIQAAAVPMLDATVLLQAAQGGPDIDEDDDCKVTDEPRDFPSYRRFPGPIWGWVDNVGVPTVRPSGGRIP